jgi:four helix bundle protein
MEQRVNGFESLHVWQKSQDLAVEVYAVLKLFPKYEEFGLSSQLRRASSSISANIAEGYGRSTTNDKIHFMNIAYGSLLETKNFVYLAERLEYIDNKTSLELLALCVSCQRLLSGYKKSLSS